ncbi:MAG: hypothetical protein IJK23_15040 [Clostridia bacterium]|nr:hypothetical protein [Clostridia bacterium]
MNYSNPTTEWMRPLDDALSVETLFLPGAHDCASARVFFAPIGRCQSMTIADQLNAGCRYFDLRLSVRRERLAAVHGPAPCYSQRPGAGGAPLYADEVFETFFSFLDAHPSETALVSIQQDGIQDPVFRTILYENYISLNENYFYLENRFPTLGETRGKLVLLRRFETAPGVDDMTGGINVIDAWNHYAQNDAFPCVDTIPSCDGRGVVGTLCLQDAFKFGVRRKWERAVKPTIERGRKPGELYINFLSCTGRISPLAAAIPLNKKFFAEPLLRGGGIYVFDFFTRELAEKVISFNFK